jgi:endonuclease YncB( thermonuclease family)
MGRCPRLLACILLVIVLGFSGSAPAASPRFIVATVQRLSGGDTVTAIPANGNKLRIRLLDIDALEIPHGMKPGQH